MKTVLLPHRHHYRRHAQPPEQRLIAWTRANLRPLLRQLWQTLKRLLRSET